MAYSGLTVTTCFRNVPYIYHMRRFRGLFRMCSSRTRRARSLRPPKFCALPGPAPMWGEAFLTSIFPGMKKILEVDPSADPSLFSVYKPGALERSVTVLPPLTGVLNVGDLEPYRYESIAQKGKKSKRRNSKAAPVPVVEQDTLVEADASEPVNPTSGAWPTHPVSPPTYPGASRGPHSFIAYEDLELHDTDSATNARNTRMMYNQFGRTGSSLDAGHIVDPRLAVRSIPPLPPSRSAMSPLPPLPGALVHPSAQYVESYAHNIPASSFPRTYTAHPAAGPSNHATHMQAQEGYSTTHMGSSTAARQPSVRRTQDGRRTVARADPSSMSDLHQSPTQRYNPYARRFSQTALHTPVVGQGASAVPTRLVDPHGSATFGEQAVPNAFPAMTSGGNFIYPPQVATYSHSGVMFPPQTTPSQTSSWSAPPVPDDFDVSQVVSAAMYDGEWSPSDEDLQALQDTMDHTYSSGP